MVRPVGGGSGRRFVWGVIAVLLAAAAVTQVYTVRSDMPPPVAVVVHEAASDRTMMHAVEVHPEPPRARQNWMKKPKVAPVPAEPAGPPWKATIESTPLRQPEAWADALDALRTQITHDLQLNRPPTREWVNDERHVRKVSVVEEKVSPRTGDAIGLPDAVKVRIEAELTPSGWTELANLQRADRKGSRMEMAIFGLGVLTVLLGAVAGYIRVDEWTKGYYSGRLLLAAVVLVTAAAGGIFLLLQA
jgi:hypothetical protein